MRAKKAPLWKEKCGGGYLQQPGSVFVTKSFSLRDAQLKCHSRSFEKETDDEICFSL